jgi:hypothetical protein
MLWSFLVSVNGGANGDHVASGAADENEGSGELNVDLLKRKITEILSFSLSDSFHTTSRFQYQKEEALSG